ncbi:MAG TPA: hypothetical protein VLX68_04685 [Chitinivibrionales bacterium]|nr:hypothetical protein [Chitinivibrionales bacterium]
MKFLAAYLASIASTFLFLPFLSNAAPIFPENEAGTPLCLFGSDSTAMRKNITVNDTLSVYRTNPKGKLYEVGKIKVVAVADNYFLKGVVIAGKLMDHDLAFKGALVLLIFSLGGSCP